MTIRPAPWGAFAAVLGLFACQDDPWIFRPLDGAPAGDAVTSDQAPPADVDDAATRLDVADATPSDVPVAEDRVGNDALPDAAIADAALPDAALPDAALPDAAMPGTLTLRSAGFVSTAANVPSSGGLRLSETGFEFGSRTCAGSLCLVGGLTP